MNEDTEASWDTQQLVAESPDLGPQARVFPSASLPRGASAHSPSQALSGRQAKGEGDQSVGQHLH